MESTRIQVQPKILFVDCAPFCGGAQESLWTILEALSQREDCHIGLLCGTGLAERAAGASFPVWQLDCRHWPASPRGLWQYWQDARHCRPVIAKVLQEFAPDIIHANCIRAALLMRRFASMNQLIVHDRDLRMPRMVPWLLKTVHPQIIAISQAVAAKWHDVVPAERCEVVANAVAAPVVSESSSEEMTPPAEVALVADFVRWKNHGLFIEAMQLVHGMEPAVTAVIKGRIRDEDGRRYLDELRRDIQQRGLQDVVRLDDRQMSAAAVLTTASVVVSTAQDEPFGRTVVEALALGKPVVAVRGGGVTDILQSCEVASLLPPDAKMMAKSVLHWKSLSQCAKVKEKALQTASAYQVSTIIPYLLTLYQRMLRK